MNNLLLLCGDSGCGKSTLTHNLINNWSEYYTSIKSYVSRPRRENEIDGKDYYFVSKEQILSWEKHKELAQIAYFGCNIYCTKIEQYYTGKKVNILSVVPEHISIIKKMVRVDTKIIFFNISENKIKENLKGLPEDIILKRISRGDISKRFLSSGIVPDYTVTDAKLNQTLHKDVHLYVGHSED